MKNRTLLYPLALAIAAGLTLSGCVPAPSEPNSAPTATTASSTDNGTPAASASAAATEHNEADTMFAQMMLPHHEQAITMSDMMLAKGTSIDSSIGDLATDIKAAQKPEIEKMNSWLSLWNEPVSAGTMGHSMEGMLGDEELAALDASQGIEATRLFLTQMVGHHKGAVQMAEDAIADGSNPEVISLATSVVKDQQAEIKAMEELLQDYK